MQNNDNIEINKIRRDIIIEKSINEFIKYRLDDKTNEMINAFHEQDVFLLSQYLRSIVTCHNSY